MVMDLKMAFSPGVGDIKVRLREETRRTQCAREAAVAWKEFFNRLAAEVRVVFMFLLGATLLVFMYSHAATIQHTTGSKVRAIALKVSDSPRLAPIRETILNEEKQVDEAAH